MHCRVSFLVLLLASATTSQEATNVPDATSTQNAAAPSGTGAVAPDGTPVMTDQTTLSTTTTTAGETTTLDPAKMAELGNKTAEIIAQAAPNVTIPTEPPDGVCGYTRTP